MHNSWSKKTRTIKNLFIELITIIEKYTAPPKSHSRHSLFIILLLIAIVLIINVGKNTKSGSFIDYPRITDTTQRYFLAVIFSYYQMIK